MTTNKKSYRAFRTISEASEILEVPAHVLRFWETKFESLTPLKRAGGRRYYRPNDISLLYGIKHFLYGKKLSIRKTQALLRKRDKKLILEIGKEKYLSKSKNTADLAYNNLREIRQKYSDRKANLINTLNRKVGFLDNYQKKKLKNLALDLKNIMNRINYRLH